MPDSEKKFYHYLSKEWELKGPRGILDVGDVVSILSLAPEGYARISNYLKP